MIRKLYNWTMGLASHRRAMSALAAVSFAESSFFPIPPDVLMIPMILARRTKAFVIASVATLSSVVGGLAGYAIGALLFDTLGAWVLDFYGKADAATEFTAWFTQYGAWAVLFAGVTPFPFKVITITSGWVGLPLTVFVAASIVARGLRFFIVASLLWYFGQPIQDFIERRLGLVFTLFMICLIGGFALVKFL